jgi:hypothetical protein
VERTTLLRELNQKNHYQQIKNNNMAKKRIPPASKSASLKMTKKVGDLKMTKKIGDLKMTKTIKKMPYKKPSNEMKSR